MSFHTLIASDLDGTLLMDPVGALSDELFQTIRNLRKKGFLFCVASGRSYASLQALFAPVADEIVYAVENGSLVYGEGRLLSQTFLPEPLWRELASEIHARPDCELRISTPNQVYRFAKDGLIRDFLNLPGVKQMIPITSLEQISEAVTKLTALAPGGVEAAAAALSAKWQSRINVTITGSFWLDFSPSSKAEGLKTVCEQYKISLKKTIAFGDSFNDVSMLDLAGTAYLMENAPAQLKEHFPRHCCSVLEALKQINAGGIPG